VCKYILTSNAHEVSVLGNWGASSLVASHGNQVKYVTV
jgi:hypothetical protein